jgi:hypothetical protein
MKKFCRVFDWAVAMCVGYMMYPNSHLLSVALGVGATVVLVHKLMKDEKEHQRANDQMLSDMRAARASLEKQ